MDYSKLNNWLQVSANIGIVLGLVLVGVQLKQNSDLTRIQLLYEESNRVIEFEYQLVGEEGAAVWAKSIEDPQNLTLAEVRIMEAMLWSFIEQLRGTHRLAELGLLEEADWRNRLENEVAFYLSDPYSRAWWNNYGVENEALPQNFRDAVNAVMAADRMSSLDYISAPQRMLEPASDTE